jgi:uncharacterized membrane protein
MDKIVRQGQYVFAAAIVALGVEHLIWAQFGGKTPPIIPWVPGGPVMTYVTGAFLIATGVCIAFNFRARVASMLFAGLFLACVVLLRAPQLVRTRCAGTFGRRSLRSCRLAPSR